MFRGLLACDIPIVSFHQAAESDDDDVEQEAATDLNIMQDEQVQTLHKIFNCGIFLLRR